MAMIGFDANGDWVELDDGLTIMQVPDGEYTDLIRDLKAGKHLDERRKHRYALSYVEAQMTEDWPEETVHGEALLVLDYFTQKEKVWKSV